MKTLAIDSLDDLPDAAEAVIDALAGRTVVAFRGEMGAGKTTLIGAILDRLGSADTVTSPTFALVNQYDTADGRPVFHFDFYRIDRIEEAYDFGYEGVFLFGQPLSGRVARKNRGAAPRRHDDGFASAWTAPSSARCSSTEAAVRTARAAHCRSAAPCRSPRRGQMRGFCTRRITSESA